VTVPVSRMSVFPLGPLPVRRSGYGAMQLAGQFASGSSPDRATAISGAAPFLARCQSPGSHSP